MKRAVRNLIRFIAASLMIFGGFAIGLEMLRHRVNDTAIRLEPCVTGSALIVAGGILFAVSGGLAKRLTDDDDDDDDSDNNNADLNLPPSDSNL